MTAEERREAKELAVRLGETPEGLLVVSLLADLEQAERRGRDLREALKKAAAVLSGESMSKSSLIAALEAARAALSDSGAGSSPGGDLPTKDSAAACNGEGSRP